MGQPIYILVFDRGYFASVFISSSCLTWRKMNTGYFFFKIIELFYSWGGSIFYVEKRPRVIILLGSLFFFTPVVNNLATAWYIFLTWHYRASFKKKTIKVAAKYFCDKTILRTPETLFTASKNCYVGRQ